MSPPVLVDVFVYSPDAATTLRDDEGLLEEHWSSMDAFAESARVAPVRCRPRASRPRYGSG